jgi:hypothetical protein
MFCPPVTYDEYAASLDDEVAQRELEERFENHKYDRVARMERWLKQYIWYPWWVRLVGSPRDYLYLQASIGLRVTRCETLLALLETYLADNYPGVAFPARLPVPLRPPFRLLVGIYRRAGVLEAQFLLLDAPLAPYRDTVVFPVACCATAHCGAALLRRSVRIASQRN